MTPRGIEFDFLPESPEEGRKYAHRRLSGVGQIVTQIVKLNAIKTAGFELAVFYVQSVTLELQNVCIHFVNCTRKTTKQLRKITFL